MRRPAESKTRGIEREGTMHRTLRRGLWAGLLPILLGACSSSDPGTGPGSVLPDGDLVATIVRVVRPDEAFWVVPFPPDPAPGTGDAGSWSETAPNDYRDDSVFALVGSGYFESLETGEPVPILVQVGSSSAGASLRAAIDQVRGTLGVFGLRDHTVWVTVDVYRLRNPGG
jgi:hypothetical protein